MDDTTIFVRTQRGTLHARDASIEMPRGMRTLLLSIDGRTRVASYRMILNHLGDVCMLLEGLENAGYIARTSGPLTRLGVTAPRGNAAAFEFDAPAHAAVSASTLSASTATAAPRAAQPAGGNAQNFELLAKIQEAQSHFMPNNAASQFGQRDANPIRTAGLNRAKSLITDFLMQHLPDVAMEVSLSIDRITSVDELERSLSDYAQLVAPLGRTGAEHLRDVKACIAR